MDKETEPLQSVIREQENKEGGRFTILVSKYIALDYRSS